MSDNVLSGVNVMQDELETLSLGRDVMPSAGKVIESLKSSQDDDHKGNVTNDKQTYSFQKLCEKYFQIEDETTARNIVKEIETFQLTCEDVVGVLLGFAAKARYSPSDVHIIAAVINQERSPEAIVFIYGENHESLESFLRKTCATGGSALASLITKLLDETLWGKFNEYRLDSLAKLSSILLHNLCDPTSPVAEINMQYLARIIALNSNPIISGVQPEHLEHILLLLISNTSAITPGCATVFIAKYLEAAPEEANALITQFVVSRVAKQTTNDLVIAFSVAAAVFPITPTISAGLFLSAGFIDDLVRIVNRTIGNKLKLAVLDLLSAACIDASCRQVINQKCKTWLQEVMSTSRSDREIVLAALVLTKCRSVTGSTATQQRQTQDDDQDLVSVFSRILLGKNDIATEYAIEGLAYASIIVKVKDKLVKDIPLLKRFFDILKESKLRASALFGVWSIVSNLTMYPPVMSAEQKRLAQIQAYADHSKSAQQNQHDRDDQVAERCRKLVDNGLVSVLVVCSKSKLPTIVHLIAGIILSLTREPKIRGTLVQQGLFDTMIRYANINAPNESRMQQACHQSTFALAQTLTSINPSLVFRKVSVESAIQPLAKLITSSDEKPSGLGDDIEKYVKPTFEALRAITNLASMDERTRIIITDRAFPQIISHLWSNNIAIIQAATECILNLTLSYSAASKFFLTSISRNEATSTQDFPSQASNIASATSKGFLSKTNNTLHLVSALTHSSSPGTRRAATATLAHIFAWSEGVIAFLTLKNGVNALISVITEAVTEADMDWLIRGTMAILLLLSTDMEGAEDANSSVPKTSRGSEEAKKRIKMANGVQIFSAMKNVNLGQSEDIGDMVTEILQYLKA